MKKKIVVTLSALLTLTLLAVGALFVGAASTSTEPSLEIKGCNLSFSESIYIKYAVDTNIDLSAADKVELLVTVDGTAKDPIESYYMDNDIGYYVFDFKELAAKNMTDNVYAKVHVKIGDKDYYSNVKKYSVLQYAYKMIENDGTDKSLKDLLKGMLEYGALAQKHFGYNTDRLANANWYLVNVVGGTLADGFNSGLYIEGDSVTLTAPEKDADGKSFAYFVDDEGKKVSSPVTVGKKNATYTPVYVNYSTGLTFTSNGDGTCYVSGIGSCTDNEIIIPPTSLDGETVVGIGESAFANSNMTEITIPNTVKKVENNAFDGCQNLEKVNFDAKESEWKDVEIAEGNDALENATKYLDGSTLSSGLSYAVNEDGITCTITGIGGCKSTVLGIPETIDGYTVTAIGEKAFADCTQLTEITIPSTVKTIGKRAFYGCTGITEMTIPESVTSIGTQIFYKATNLTTVNYYSSYYSSDNALLSTGSISKVKFKSTSTAKSMLQQCSNIKEVVLAEGITSIGSSAFYNCTSLTSITIPDSVTSIGYEAFSGCTSLTSITIPDSVTSIGYEAFSGCTSLKKVYYKGDVESWLNILFNDYDSNPCCNGAELYFKGTLVTEVDIPDTVEKIGSYAFYNCTSLTSITIPDSVTSIGEYAFYNCTSLTSITIPDSVTSIGSYAFYNCTSLTSITIPDSVTSIGEYAFYNCTSLTSITIPDSVTSIDSCAFRGCTSLTSITIPDSVTTIGNYVFYYCTSLTSITIGNGVTSIGYDAFYGCTSLASVTIGNSVTSIGNYAFYGCSSLKKVYYKGTADEWSKNIIDNTYDGNSYLTSADRYYYSETEPTEAGYFWHYVDEVPTIWKMPTTFNYTVNDDNVSCTITGLVANTEDELIIPETIDGYKVTAIGVDAFKNNKTITSVTVPDCVTSIGGNAFLYCSNLVSVKLGKGIQKIAVYDNCGTFEGCTSLESVIIPANVTSVQQYAFYNCSSLKKVYYVGAADEWSEISISSDNSCLTSATRYYLSETEPTTRGNFWHYVDGVVTEWEVKTNSNNSVVKKTYNLIENDGVYTVVDDSLAYSSSWGIGVLGESDNWEVTMTLNHNVGNAEYGLQICGKDDNGDGLILEGDDSFLQIYLSGNDIIRLIGCDNAWGNVDGYQWDNINRYTGLGNKDELTLTVKLNGKNLSYWVDGVQCGDTIVLDDSVMYGNVVTLFMKHTDTSISNVTFKDNNITVIDAKGGEAGEFKIGDVADVTKKYFAVSYTMLASTYAGDPSDNGCCGLFFGSNDDTCIFIPYEGGNTDTQRKLGIWGGNNLVFGNWWGQPCIFNGTASAEITPDTEVTVLVLGVKGDDGKTTVTAYLNGEQINVWGGDLTAKGDFDGHIGWATRLSGQEATVKFTESDSPISSTVFD